MKNSAAVFPISINDLTDSLLYRRWKTSLIFSWIIFLLYEILTCLQSYAFSKPLCSLHNTQSFQSLASSVSLGGFCLAALLLFLKVLRTKSGNERIPSIISLNIVLVGAVSTLFFVAFNWNGVCIDVLGVTTPAIMWGEWFANGPTLVFLTIALSGKQELSKIDWAIITSFFMCILFGFLPIIPQPQFLGFVWIALAMVACVPVLLLPWYVSAFKEEPESAADMEEGSRRGSKQSATRKAHKQQFYSALWLSCICPLFPANYILAATKVIGPGDSVGIFLLLTLLMKAAFTATLADMHTETYVDALREIEQEWDRQAVLNVLDKERYANESRKDFMKYLFHEVRTPLNSLTMGLELLRDRNALDATDKEVADMMKGAASFMEDTLNNVLSMQKIEEGKMELTLAPFSIRHSITKILSALSAPAITKNLRINQMVSADVPGVLVGDVYSVEHLISNLLSNAIKFSPQEGTIQVKVILQAIPGIQASTSSTSVTVSISDEGPGISAENQRRLFTGFFQVRPHELQQGKGSGLGLALCKQIVTLHGGTIGVNSTEGQGSTFHFCIPFSIPNADNSNELVEEKKGEKLDMLKASSPTASKCASIRSESSSYNGPDISARILVVDDVASNCKMLQALLKRNGAKFVDLAENGLEAVQVALADPHKYGIIFMDNLMPIMNGLEASIKLREGGYRNLVIGVTGNVLDDDVVQYLAAGADMIMGKPVKIALLRMLLRHVLEHGTLSRPTMHLTEEERIDSNRLTWKPKEG